MPHISRNHLFALLLGVTLACDEGPSGVSTGNLLIAVSGLPAGSPADLVVTGPGSYSQSVASTQTLTGLTPGSYTITANNVTVAAATYSGSPASQTVAVGGSTATATIFYSPPVGSLRVTINGLGTSTDAAVTITGPNGYSQSIAATQTVTGLTPGTYTVAAQDVVATGGTPHTPSPATQDVTVAATGTAAAAVTYSPPNSGALNLRIAGLYLTQSAQTLDGSVPLVKDRNGYLRVFAVANRTNTEIPTVRIRIYNNSNAVVASVLVPAPRVSVPTSVDESSLSNSWNTAVDGMLIQPGFRIEAEVDSAGLIAESDENDNLLAPPAPVVRTVPALDVTFVPIVQSNGLTGNVSNANKDAFLASVQKMHPIAAVNSAVHAPYTTTTADTLQAQNANSAWGTILQEIEALRVAESSSRYYYGVAKVSYTSGVAGVAYVSNGFGERASLGWDYLPTGAAVAAHELGHNWGRNHAPCGGPGGVDGGFPYPDGRIGVYGMDVGAASLKPATTSDIMGYCDPKWIGAYTYSAVMNYLISPPPAPMISASSQAVQPSLLVWGHIRNGVMVLEPALQVMTRPSLPSRPGPFTLEAKADDGSPLFRLSFTPSEIADAPGGGQSFVFAVPLAAAQASRLASLRLAGQGREVMRTRSPAAALSPRFSVAGNAEPAQVRRAAGGKVRIRWDAGVYPMVMVRDPQSGEILSFARGGSVEIAGGNGEVDLVLSDGVRSSVKRVSVTP